MLGPARLAASYQRADAVAPVVPAAGHPVVLAVVRPVVLAAAHVDHAAVRVAHPAPAAGSLLINDVVCFELGNSQHVF